MQTENDKITTPFKRSADIFEQLAEILNIEGDILLPLRSYSNNPSIDAFVNAMVEGTSERAKKLCDAKEVDIPYAVALLNSLELTVIAVSHLVERKGTVAELGLIMSRLWQALSAIDVAIGLCPSRQEWIPPAKAVHAVKMIASELQT